MAKRAVFIDRDKTIIEDPGYIGSPDMVKLLPGAAEAIRLLNDSGYTVVVATNQSGVARGLLTEETLEAIHQRLRELLAEEGARIDAIYYCPYLSGPRATVEEYRKSSDLRKPKPGMLFKAADEHDLDLPASWMIGDSARDIIAGTDAGCRTVLIRHTDAGALAEPCKPHLVAVSLLDAVNLVLRAPESRPAAATPNAGAAAANSVPEAAGSSDPAVVLGEIRDMLRRRERRARYEDFSVARLTATLTQMLAVVAAAWGVAALFTDGATALTRFALATFLQLLTLTAVLMDRRM